MPILNHQLDLIRQSATVGINDRVIELKASGRKIVGLHVGDPDFATPQPVMDVALQAMRDGLTHYAPSRGFLELRQAVAVRRLRDEGLTCDPQSEILITHGGIHAYYVAMQSILNPGDEVLIPDPSWATHINMAVMLRGKVVRIPAPAENGFIPFFESWEKALTRRTRVIVLNYPSNPTGSFPTREYVEKLQAFATAHNLWIVSDEIYGSLHYDEKPTSAAAIEGAASNTIIVNSLSKAYAMTGWRVGYLIAPGQVIENALKAAQNSITCVAPFVQKAAAFALTDPSIQQFTEQMRLTYARRRERVLEISRQVKSGKVSVRPPMGAFYFFLDFRPLKMSSHRICERILAETGVALMPGSAFGSQGEGFVRMSIAASDEDVETGFRKILEWADAQ